MIELYDKNDYIINLAEVSDDKLNELIGIYICYEYNATIYDETANDYVDDVESIREFENYSCYEWYNKNIMLAMTKIKNELDEICNNINKKANGIYTIRYVPNKNFIEDDYFAVCFKLSSNQPIAQNIYLDLNPMVEIIKNAIRFIKDIDISWDEDFLVYPSLGSLYSDGYDDETHYFTGTADLELIPDGYEFL